MELTRTDGVFSRIAMVLFLCRNKSSWNDLKIHGDYFWKNIKNTGETIKARGPTPCPRGWGAHPPPGRAPVSWAPLRLRRPQLQLHIFRLAEKKIREKVSSCFTIWSRRQALKPLRRADLESIRGSREGNPSPSSSSTILHHQFHDAHRRA